MSKQPTHKVTITEGVVPSEPKRPVASTPTTQPHDLESLPFVLQQFGQALREEEDEEARLKKEAAELLRGAMEEWDKGLWRWDDQFIRDMQKVQQRIGALLSQPQVEDRAWTVDLCTHFSEFVITIERARDRTAVRTVGGQA